MRLRRRRDAPAQEDYPPSITRAFVRQMLPSASPGEARGMLQRLRDKGWTEQDVEELVEPYVPNSHPVRTADDARRVGELAMSLPPGVATLWLDRQLPGFDEAQIRLVVEGLERRGCSPRDSALLVLPHLLPKLSAEDAHVVLGGLASLGLTQAEIDRLKLGR